MRGWGVAQWTKGLLYNLEGFDLSEDMYKSWAWLYTLVVFD